MKLTKKIFGKNYRFTCNDLFASVLIPGIDLYPDGDEEKADVTINIQEISSNQGILAQNPAIFQKKESAICMQLPQAKIRWELDQKTGQLFIQLQVPPKRKKMKQFYASFRSKEYATEVETFQQTLHELVLVPSVYFLKDLSIIHAAVFSINGKAALLAGTGGTGKTSALLSLRKRKDVAFVSDDIAIVSTDGYVYPNLAWPKIYGYNLSSYITKKELLKGRGYLDKFQFDYRLKRNPKTVRRKLKPNILYQDYANLQVPIQNVFYLFRDNSKEMFSEPLEKEKAIQMGLHVMKTEYNVFHNYLEWDQYNSIALGSEPLLKVEKVFEIWKHNLEKPFANANIQILHIPFNIPHEDYLKNIHQYILGK